ncbi:MAG: hypothetical protein K6G04_09310 [Lachnospiraceae bacterium]|nr:hypothetical protein [Lachnospiraceae bacterium]
MDYTTAYSIGRIAGALVMGALLGLVPLISGIKKQKIGFAIGGFFACVVAGFLLGIILGLPVCALFTFLILRDTNQTNPVDQAPSQDANPTIDPNSNDQ